MTISTEALPPQNPRAQGLHLTDPEYITLIAAIAAEPRIVRAMIYGSRQTGVRREKATAEQLDIDIAIEVRPSRPDQAFLEFWEIRDRLRAIPHLGLQPEDLTDSASPFHADRLAGVELLLPHQAGDRRHSARHDAP